MPSAEVANADVHLEELDLAPVREASNEAAVLNADEVFTLASLVPAWNGQIAANDADEQSFAELFLAANKSAGFQPMIVASNPGAIAGASDPQKLRIQIKNRLSVLELSNANIGPGGAALLAEHLKSLNGRCMTEVRLDCNALGDNGARAICQAMTKDHHITVVSMEMNAITKDSCSVISRMLRRVPTVAKFHVGNNPLGDDGVATIAAVLRDSITLGEIGLSATNITAVGARAVADALANNSSLTHVLLNRNAITDEGVRALADALERRSTLRCIELAEVGMSTEGAKRLGDMYRADRTLTRMVVGPNPFGDDGAKALAAALRENVCLTSVEMDRCNIGDEGAKAIIDAINFNKESRVRTIQLNENALSASTVQQLQRFGEARKVKVAVGPNKSNAAKARPDTANVASTGVTGRQKKEDGNCCTTM